MEAKQTLPPPVWVDTPAAVQAMLKRLSGAAALALDTESNSLYVYQEQVCLIQISVPGIDYLVDPLAVPDLSGLGPLLADPAVLKVLHGGEYDLSGLHRDFGFTLANLFDTMWASRILGWPAHGLAALLQAHFGVSLNKKYQRADWGRRPLPPEQLDYARMDSHYLLPLAEIQKQALTAGRRWPQAQHRFAELAQTRWEPHSFDPEGFWQMPGSRELDDIGRGVLRALCLLRDQQAQAENRPPFKLLTNAVLIALSEARPQTIDDLRQVKGIPARQLYHNGQAILAAIGQGAKQPLALQDRPRSANHGERNGNGRPGPACQARFEALRTWRNRAAETRGVEPDIVLNNQTLWAVAHRNPRNQADLTRDGLLAPWQLDEFGQDLLRVLKSRG